MTERSTNDEMTRKVEELERRCLLAGESARQSDERFQALFNRSFDVVYLHDFAGRIMDVNQAALDLFGYSRDEMLALTLASLISDDQMPQVDRTFRELRETGSQKRPYEYRVRCRDGSFVWLETKACVIYREGEPCAVQGIARDITQWKMTVDRLKKSEERYRSILETMEEAYYEVDLEGNFTFFNITAARNLGYSDEEMMGMNYLRFVDKENARKVFEAYHRVFVTGESIRGFDWEFINKKGARMAVEASVTLQRDDRGNPTGFKGVVRDISKRKQAEEALRESERKYRSILESMEEAYFEVDLKGDFTFFNGALCRVLGYDRHDLMGMNNRVYTTPETARLAYQIFSEIHRTGIPRSLVNYEIIRKDGGRRVLEMSISQRLGPSGEPDGFRVLARDVTKRIQSEQALRESEERFRDLAELLPETVFETDLEGRLTFINRSAFEQFGYEEGDLAAGLTIFDVIAPEDHVEAKESMQRVFSGENEGLREYTAVKKDKTTFCSMIRATPILRDNGCVGMRGFVIDISEKKNLEEQLARSQKMEAIGTLAGGIAHDFNNLLMGILGNVSLLLMKMDDAHPFRDRLKSMEDYVQRGSDLTKQLLGFARGGKYEVRPTHLGEFLRRSSEMFGRTKKEVLIHRKVSDGLWSVEVDRGQMEQVCLNLFVNAWQAMPGGGDLYLSVENVDLDATDVSPHGLRPGRYVKVTVTDTGVGMDEATIARIFEPFFTTKDRGRGTGLGLASVYGIIKNHGGFIRVESEKGIGSTFMLYLPASDKAGSVEKKTGEGICRGNGTILLIDDEEMILDVGSQMLSGLGYTVLTARGGRAGIEEYRRDPLRIDLVILDIIMPDLGGGETFERLRAVDAGVKVLLSSGYSLDGQAKEIMEKGCRGFIQKPFSLEDLSRRIREIMDGQ